MIETQSIKTSKNIHYFIIYAACSVSLGLIFAALGPLLPTIAEHVNVSLGQISFLFTAHSLGYLLGSTGGGKLYDRVKGHFLMVSALFIMLIMSFLIPIIPEYFLLLSFVVLLGLGQGLLDVGMNVSLLWVYQSQVSPYMNGLHFFFGIGALISPILIHQIIRLTDSALKLPFWTLRLLTLPSLLALFLLKSPTNPEKDHHPHEEHASQKSSLLILMMILFFIYVGVEGGYGGWIFSYVTKLKITSESNAAYINSLYWGALTLGRLITVGLANKIKPGQILLGNFIISILSLGLILFFPTQPQIIWLGSAGLGLGFSSVFPTLLVLAETRLKITGQVTGLFFMGSSLGGMILPMVFGQIFENIGTYQMLLAMFTILILGLLVLISVILASDRAGEKVRAT